MRNKLQTVCSLSCFVRSSFSFCHWETGKVSATEVNVFREAYFINKFNFNSLCILMKRREYSASQLRNWSMYSDTKSHFTLGIFGIINRAEFCCATRQNDVWDLWWMSQSKALLSLTPLDSVVG